MAVKTQISIFCMCGGVWIVKELNNKRFLVCPICGMQKPIPNDTSMFQMKVK
jgi:hypothetical protein